MIDEAIVRKVVTGEAYRVERDALARGGSQVSERPGLMKQLENKKVRLIFPTDARIVEHGTAVGLVCLFDQVDDVNIYAHPVFAGPSVNTALRSLFVPEAQAHPQPGIAGYKAREKFTAWKTAAWFKFLTDELELGTERASALWLTSFWKALDRMYGGGNLQTDALPA